MLPIFPLGLFLLQFTDCKLLNENLFGIFSSILFVQGLGLFYLAYIN